MLSFAARRRTFRGSLMEQIYDQSAQQTGKLRTIPDSFEDAVLNDCLSELRELLPSAFVGVES